ncbi:PssE/Cps14G family polysaccharide biosynthesis glycosyltransferase [Neobacillus drentensis]|uniref:PssE/Cps14G family polysaccharide biosynthesis glycosyltransferase n=1 Tax=Neobacillus drentensis TaxID=220684 RepID=UPI0030027699
MIFVTLGSQKFQFNRLLLEIDNLVKKNILKPNEVFAQIGYSTYEPKTYSFKKFLNKEEFLEYIEKSNIVVTHGGTGSIINSVKKGKKVIGVPRLAEFGEHVDNHQLEIIEQFTNSDLIYGVLDIKELGDSIGKVKDMVFRSYRSNSNNIINILEDFLDTSFK